MALSADLLSILVCPACRGQLEYDANAYRQEDVNRLAAQLETLFTAAAGNPETALGRLHLLPAAEEDAAPLPYTLAGVGEKIVRKLVDAGFTTQEAVAAASVEQLSEVPGVGGKTAEKILAAARGETQE